MSKIAILYIAIGKYDRFWKGFYMSSETYFLPGFQKTYFVFTDSKHIKSDVQINTLPATDQGWPFNTLNRFNYFHQLANQLSGYDYCFFFNANTLFLKPVTPGEIIPAQEESSLVHLSWFVESNLEPAAYPYERNPASSAFIPVEKSHDYYMGGLYGGSTEAFLKMTDEVISLIEMDKTNHIIAINNDESYLNKYLLDKRPRCLLKQYGRPEEWDTPNDPSIIFRQKEKVLGFFYLFRLKKKPLLYLLRQLYFRIKNLVKHS
ncbi:MAG: family 6 glucosyltransferase [Bacteroidota bacterium]|nr:family 6 glucosyltransferase [Bacteroidota bacterium]